MIVVFLFNVAIEGMSVHGEWMFYSQVPDLETGVI